RGRHTSCLSDWSSDVCSSDLRDGRRGVAGRLGEDDTTRTNRRRVLDGVGEVCLFRRHQVAKVGLHRGEIRLFLRVGKLRDRDRGQNADDHDHDEQLNKRKTLAVHLRIPLLLCHDGEHRYVVLWDYPPRPEEASRVPSTATHWTASCATIAYAVGTVRSTPSPVGQTVGFFARVLATWDVLW